METPESRNDPANRGRAVVHAPRACVAALLVLAGCGSETSPETSSPAATATAPTTPLTEAMAEQLGAASWVPADASFFASGHGLAELVEDLVDSRAVQQFQRMPTVAMGLAEARGIPPLRAIRMQRTLNPLVDELCELASAAVSREVFVYGGHQWSTFLDALWSAYGRGMLTALKGKMGPVGVNVPPLVGMIESVLEKQSALRVPPLVFGFRVPSRNAARRLLTDAVQAVRRDLPVPVQLIRIDDASFYTAHLTPDAFHGWQHLLARNLLSAGLPEADVRQFVAFIQSQVLVVTIGVRDDYLVVSVGENNDHLQQLGNGSSLAASSRFEFVRRHIKPDLLSLCFVSEHLRQRGLNVEDAVSVLRSALPAAPLAETAGDLIDDLERDVRALVADINAATPDPVPYASVSFRNRGIEGFEFGTQAATGDSDKSLSILENAGPSPLAAFATRPASMTHAYDRAAHWVGVLGGYFERLAVPQMSLPERQKFEQFRDVVGPALREFDGIAREMLIPAVDECQSMLALVPGGELREIPGLDVQPSSPLEFPHPVLVWELADKDKLVDGCARLRKMINATLARAAERIDGVDPIPPIPAPKSKPVAGGTMYSYDMPPEAPAWLLPNVIVTGTTAVMSLSADQSQSILQGKATAPEGIVNLLGPAASAQWVDFEQITGMLHHDAKVVIEYLATTQDITRPDAVLATMHADGLAGLLGALRSYGCRSYREDGVDVQHWWLHVEDR